MTTWAEIDLAAIRANAQAIKAHIRSGTPPSPPPAKGGGGCPILIAVIKADAYGHGAIPVAQALLDEASMYAVATVQEAIELRDAGIRMPILVLFNALPDQGEAIARYQLTQSVCEPTLCKALSCIARASNRRIKVHVDVNTGMNRGGIRYTEAADFIQWLRKQDGLDIEGIFTHFAASDEVDKTYTYLQLRRFESVLSALSARDIRPPIAHAANSAAALALPASHFDAVRIGLSLYGIYPSSDIRKETQPPVHGGHVGCSFVTPLEGGLHAVALQPALSWKTRVISLHEADAGEGVSYGCTYKPEQRMWLATLPVGYADGYLRSLSNLGEALIGGKRRQLVGRVCMDGTVFRIDPPVNVAIGDEAVLIGKQEGQEITVDQVAERAGTISYEILTGIGKRVPRIYVNPELTAPTRIAVDFAHKKREVSLFLALCCMV